MNRLDKIKKILNLPDDVKRIDFTIEVHEDYLAFVAHCTQECKSWEQFDALLEVFQELRPPRLKEKDND